MPISDANDAVRKDLDDLTAEPWLNDDAINKLFKTAEERKQLSELRSVPKEATQKNEAAADTWNRIGTIKDVVIKLVKKSVGVP
jgi:hypothetical protein